MDRRASEKFMMFCKIHTYYIMAADIYEKSNHHIYTSAM